jgi:hypothetical protein
VLFRLYDMHDWNTLIKGTFRRLNIGFDLHNTILRIKSIMTHQALQKEISLVMYA